MKKENILNLKKMFPNLFYENNKSKTVIDASDECFNRIVDFCDEISKKSNTVKITLIKESNNGLSFFINEYTDELINIVYLHEKNNFKTMCK